MEGFIPALHAAAYQDVCELHLSTLGGLHVIPKHERNRGNVFQSTIRGRWESRHVFYCITGERLIVGADRKARWGRDDWQGMKPYQWAP